MNWNNDSLCDTVPTTLRYAQALAQLIKIPTLQAKPQDYCILIYPAILPDRASR